MKLQIDGQPSEWPPFVKTYRFDENEDQKVVVHDFLKFLNGTNLYADLEFHADDDQGGAFHLRRKWKLVEINLGGVPYFLERDLLSGRLLVSGSFFSDWDLFLDFQSLQKQIEERGYLKAEVVDVQLADLGDGAKVLSYQVELGPLCQIDKVLYVKESLPDLTRFLQEQNLLCSQKKLETLVEGYFSNLREDGYLNARLNSVQIDLASDREYGSLTLDVEKGERFDIRIIEVPGVKEKPLANVSSDYYKKFFYEKLGKKSFSEIEIQIKQIYQNQGYIDAKVVDREIFQRKSFRLIRIYVEKGPFWVLKEMTFSEDLPFSSNQIPILLGFEKGFLKQEIPFNRRQMAQVQNRLEGLLQDAGYLFAQIENIQLVEKQKSNFVEVGVHVDLSLGKRAWVREVGVQLPSPLKEEFLALEGVRLLQNKVFSSQDLKEMKLLLEGFLLDKGYSFSQIEVKLGVISEDPFDVKLDVQVELGQPLLIGGVFLETDIVGKDDRLIQCSQLKSGDPLSIQRMERARRLLSMTNLFQSIKIVPQLRQESGSFPNQLADVFIQAKSKNSRLLNLRPSYGTVSGYEFSSRYLFNRITEGGLYFSLSGLLSEEKNFRVYESPDVLGRSFSLLLSEPLFPVNDYVTPFIWESDLKFEIHSNDWGKYSRRQEQIRILWPSYFWSSFVTLWVQLSLESVIQTNEEKHLLTLFEDVDPVFNSLGLGLSLDSRNSLVWSTKGLWFEMESHWNANFLNTKPAFVKHTFDSEWIWTFPFWPVTNALLLGGGVLLSDPNEILPSSVTRLSLLDQGLIRGFPVYGLKPGPLLIFRFHENETNDFCWGTQTRPLAATHLWYLKHEFRYRLPYYSRNMVLGLSFFVDSGVLLFESHRLSQLEELFRSIGDLELANGCRIGEIDFLAEDAFPLNGRFWKDYWQRAFLSSGLGFRFILNNILKVNLDWGIPLLDPVRHRQKVSQLASDYVKFRSEYSSSILWVSDSFGYRLPGAVHLTVSAVF